MMELTATDYNILDAIATGKVEPGTSPSYFVDYCDNVIGGDPKPLIAAGYIDAGHFINGLTEKGKQALANRDQPSAWFFTPRRCSWANSTDFQSLAISNWAGWTGRPKATGFCSGQHGNAVVATRNPTLLSGQSTDFTLVAPGKSPVAKTFFAGITRTVLPNCVRADKGVGLWWFSWI